MANVIEIILDLAYAVLIIYLGVLSGIIFTRIPQLKKHQENFISIILNLFTPLIITIAILSIQTDQNRSIDWILPVVAALIVTILGIVGPKFIASLFNQPPPDPAELCNSTFPNAVNFPFPIILAFAFKEGLAIASIFLAVTVVLRNSLGFWISGYKISKESVKTVIRFPPNWGIFVGFILLFTLDEGTYTPITEHPFTNIYFQIGIFGTLMTLGFSMKKPSWDYKIPIIRVGITRFVFSGIALVILLVVFSPPAFVAIPIIVQMIAPPAVYNGIYAAKFKLDTELTSQIIVGLTLIALIFLPLELFILRALY
ncbi:MAG: hypothetical protein IH840_10470 [Candidatus Heimdallarchaeota archaeon]|nr:hypothetical protein [Candidatus Heimdallarchaeota archaeon]